MNFNRKDTGGYIRDAKELQVMQSYPLWMKVMLTKQRIREWVYQFGEDGVVVSFSGGKDSTVLLHLVREEFPNVKAVFSNTGLEYPEIQRFVKSFANVDIVTPSMNFGDVISTYGYPLISKEVAEAIYYARRIRSQTGNVEREREREDNPPQESRATRSPNLIETSSAANRRTILQGQWGKKSIGNDWKSGGQNRRRTEINGSLTTDESFNRQRRAGVVELGEFPTGTMSQVQPGMRLNRARETDSSSMDSKPG